MNQLRKSEIKYLSGVGPKRAELLAKQLDIHSFYDLLYYFPFRYIDRSTIHHITDLQGDMPYLQLKGRRCQTPTQCPFHRRNGHNRMCVVQSRETDSGKLSHRH